MIEFLNSTAETWFRTMTSASLQAGLLALGLLAVTGILRRRSPAWRHALLMIALLKFAVPPTLSLPGGFFSQLRPASSPRILKSVPYVAPIAPVLDEVLWPTEPPVEISPAPAAGAGRALNRQAAEPVASLPAMANPTIKTWLMLLHIFGLLVFLAIVTREKIRLRQLSGKAAEAANEDLCLLFDDLCAKIKLPRKPRLLVSALDHSPMTFGAWKPVVLMPQALVESLAPEELKVILGHELAHQRRWDLWLGWLQIPIAAVWWFNPIYWILSRSIRSVREDCCDDLVVATGLASGERYCDTLLQAARIASGCALNGAALAYIDESHPLRRRLKRIMSGKLITKPRLAWTAIIILILLALLFLPGIRKRSGVQNPESAAGGQKSGTPAPGAAGSSALNPGAGGLSLTTAPAAEGIPATEIQLRVIERIGGRPVANAAVILAGALAVKDVIPADAPHTDSDGRYTIPVPKTPALVTIRAEGFVPAHLRLPTSAEIPHEYVCKLDKGGTIGGFVRDEEGKPLDNVKLSIYSTNTLFDSKTSTMEAEGHDNWTYVQTDKGGRWTATELVPDPERISLTLDHPERVSMTYDTIEILSTLDPTREHVPMSDLKEDKAVLVMKSGLVISGKVMDETGRGIAGSEIIQYDAASRWSSFSNWMLDPIKTDANGQFAFRIPKAGAITIYAEAKGFAPEEREVKAVRGLPSVEFRLKKGEIVSGRVIDEGGSPIPNATVRTGNALQGRTAPFSWSGKTDESGKFVWDSAPAKPLAYSIGAPGYDYAPTQLLAPGKEHEIRLARGTEMIITGKVTDAKTRMPIDSFKVSLMIRSQGLPGRSVNGANGEFTLTMPIRTTTVVIAGRTMPMPNYGVLVEADGYGPDLSQTVESKPGNQYVEVALNRSSGFSGVVLLPGGNPAANANISICGGVTGPQISPSGGVSLGSGPTMTNNVRSVQCTMGTASANPFAALAEADASGRFTLKEVPLAHSFYAVHEKGFAALSAENLPRSGEIRLQPWGRITGVLMVGSKPGANQPVSLLSLTTAPLPPALVVMLTATTDGEGRVEFAAVPPGEYRISNRPPTGNGGSSAFVVVHSGETASIKLGGAGRPLAGKIVVTGPDPNAPPKIQSASLTLKLPDEKIPNPTDPAAYIEYLQSEAYLARLRAQRSYSIRVDADGAFRLEDIPAGTYTLRVMMARTETPRPEVLSQPDLLTREIVVPEMPGGRSDDPLDLGVINFQSSAKK